MSVYDNLVGMEEVLDEFIVETSELLEGVNEDLVHLEPEPDGEKAKAMAHRAEYLLDQHDQPEEVAPAADNGNPEVKGSQVTYNSQPEEDEELMVAEEAAFAVRYEDPTASADEPTHPSTHLPTSPPRRQTGTRPTLWPPQRPPITPPPLSTTKAAKGKEEEMAPPAASYTTYRVRGAGDRFVKQQEEPTPEFKAEPVPEAEVVKEPEVEKEMAPPVEMKEEEPTPEFKAEPVPEAEMVKEPEVEKEMAPPALIKEEEPTPEEEEIREEISVREKNTTKRSRKILFYSISRLKKIVNDISDNFLSGIWLTGVTIGLVRKSADKIKKPIIGHYELYPISRLKKTVNDISDNFLSGIWLTGVTIGLVKRSADKIKKSIVGP